MSFLCSKQLIKFFYQCQKIHYHQFGINYAHPIINSSKDDPIITSKHAIFQLLTINNSKGGFIMMLKQANVHLLSINGELNDASIIPFMVKVKVIHFKLVKFLKQFIYLNSFEQVNDQEQFKKLKAYIILLIKRVL